MDVNPIAPTVCWRDSCLNLLKPRGIGLVGRFQRYCGKACQRIDSGYDEIFNSRRCTIDGCIRPHRAKDLCATHWTAADRAKNGRDEPWNDTMRDAYHRRRVLEKKLATGVPVRFSEIAERDAWTCGICSQPVDSLVSWPHPSSPSLDHTVPLVRGGVHDPSNVVLAHLSCNIRKGDSLLA